MWENGAQVTRTNVVLKVLIGQLLRLAQNLVYLKESVCQFLLLLGVRTTTTLSCLCNGFRVRLNSVVTLFGY